MKEYSLFYVTSRIGKSGKIKITPCAATNEDEIKKIITRLYGDKCNIINIEKVDHKIDLYWLESLLNQQKPELPKSFIDSIVYTLHSAYYDTDFNYVNNEDEEPEYINKGKGGRGYTTRQLLNKEMRDVSPSKIMNMTYFRHRLNALSSIYSSNLNYMEMIRELLICMEQRACFIDIHNARKESCQKIEDDIYNHLKSFEGNDYSNDDLIKIISQLAYKMVTDRK